jgi:hypothetical protein
MKPHLPKDMMGFCKGPTCREHTWAGPSWASKVGLACQQHIGNAANIAEVAAPLPGGARKTRELQESIELFKAALARGHAIQWYLRT